MNNSATAIESSNCELMLKNNLITTSLLLSLYSVLPWQVCGANDKMQSQEYVNTFCISCHGKQSAEAGVRLDQIATSRWQDVDLFEEVYEVIEKGEMPPEDADAQPSKTQSADFQILLGKRLRSLSEQQSPGMLKRLSRTEYQNTINDVFGTNLLLKDRLPLDNLNAGFDNNADQLHISLVDMEAYFNAANLIAESVVGDKPEPRTVVYSTKNTDIDTHSHKDSTDGFAPTLNRESRPLVFAAPPTQIKINPLVKTEGIYRVVPQGFYVEATFVRGSRTEERLPAIKDVTAQPPNDENHSMSFFLRKNVGQGKSISGAISKDAAWQEFDPRKGFQTRLSADDTIVLRCNTVNGEGPQRMYCIETATVSGPLYDTWPPKTSFYENYCKNLDGTEGMDACENVLQQLAQKLYRRPVSKDQMSEVLNFAQHEYQQGRGLFAGVQAGIRGMLCSPNFLFKQEGQLEQLDDHSIAARMSYFLWNSLPDETLFELARKGMLQDAKVRCEQTLRMLDDEKAKRFITNYVHQWLDLEKLQIIEPDLSIFTLDEFDLVRDQITEEPVEFFHEVLRSNLSLLNFLDSDFVVITPELNYIYQIEGYPVAEPAKRPGEGKLPPLDYKPKKIDSEFTRVKLDEKNRYRGGLLTQAGFMLMTTNNGEYTNPFYRGAWVLKSFYGDHLETPPDLEISALSPPTKTATIKEVIDAHRENASCNGCHQKMDPFGIALENLDVMGRWRDRYSAIRNYGAAEQNSDGGKGEFPIDSKTAHMDGRSFEGPNGLKEILLQDQEKFTQNFIENILSYAMARKLTFNDREYLDSLHQQSADHNFQLRDILMAIVSSDKFTQR